MASDGSMMTKVAKACAAPVDDLYKESLLIIAGIIAVVVVGINTGTINEFYTDLTDYTTDGVPWTTLMRENPWIWPVGTLSLIYLTALVAKILRRSHRTIRLWVTAVALGLGFVGGHVYWA